MKDIKQERAVSDAIAQSYEEQCRETGSFSTGGIIAAIEAAGYSIVRSRKRS